MLNPGSFLFLALWTAGWQVTAPAPVPARFRTDYTIEDGRNSVIVPFELANNHVVVTATINGQGPFRLVVDTGMPIPGVLLWKSARTEALALSYSGSLMIQGAGSGEQAPTNAPLARGAQVGVGDLLLANQNIVVAPLTSKLARVSYHDGVIGATLFWNFLVEVDYEAAALSLHRPDRFTIPTDSRPVPLEVRGYPFATVGVATPDGEAAAHVVVDLGASHILQIKATSHPQIDVPTAALETVIGRGVGGTMHGRMARVDYIRLGSYTLQRPLVSFPDPQDEPHSGSLGRHGNLGSGLLRRFHVLFDYQNGQLWLRPNKQFGDPFEYNMSGLVLLDHDRGLVVDELLPASPASEAGVAVADVIIAIDGRSVTDYSREELRRRLRSEGRQLNLTIVRQDQTMVVEVTLRRLI